MVHQQGPQTHRSYIFLNVGNFKSIPILQKWNVYSFPVSWATVQIEENADTTHTDVKQYSATVPQSYCLLFSVYIVQSITKSISSPSSKQQFCERKIKYT